MTPTPDPFDRLAPILRHHIVNDLGWPALRPVQAATIPPVLAGENVIVLAPTAGGKTEAAFFPLLTRMIEEGWRGLSVLYLSPIRALLNNQAARLDRYHRWAGRTAALWHGDVGAAARKRLRAAPPDCLLTTPESIEAILCSRLSDPVAFFGEVRAVVIDEAHGFADGDRGWHLLAVLERLSELAGRDLQRIGLSATVGNVDALRDWLAGRSRRPRRTIAPSPPADRPTPEVTIDHVGTVEAAAKVISLLHRGEKRLVFCDSRARTERLATELRRRGVRTFVTHSSLSIDERQQAERAFAEARDCVIVSTSALELGIDVGDLDRVIQLDAPATVSSFLQRMGRTGRRSGTHPNCLFLTTRDSALVQAAAIVDLWRAGFVEPAECPPLPLHLVAQQTLALLLQQRTLPRDRLREAIARTCALFAIPAEHADPLADHLLTDGWLFDADGLVSIGPTAEKHLGGKNFLELLSAFAAPPFYTVVHGRHPIGEVHELTFFARPDAREGPIVLLLAGRAWQVNHLDPRRRLAYVEPTTEKGASRWVGTGHVIEPPVARAMGRVLRGSHAIDDLLSRRARAALADLVEEHAWLDDDRPRLVTEPDGTHTLWTFAGTRVNRALARRLRPVLDASFKPDDLSVEIRLDGDDAAARAPEILEAWQTLADGTAPAPPPLDPADAVAEKFLPCLPAPHRDLVAAAREADPPTLAALLTTPLRPTRLPP